MRLFLQWWWRQFCDLLPVGWRRSGAEREARDSVVLALAEPLAGQPPSVEVSLHRPRGVGRLGRFALDPRGLEALRAAIGPARRGALRLALPPRLILEQPLTLPLAAERDLDSVLRFEMDRLTPFPADSVFWSWVLDGRDRQRGRLNLRLRLVPKAAVDGVLQALAAAGLRPALLEAAAGPPRSVSLSDVHGKRRGRGAGLALLAAGCACLAVAAVVLPFVRQELALRQIEARITELRPEVETADALRQRLLARAASADVMAGEAARVGDTLKVLADLTELLPDDTHLFEFSLRDRVLVIGGESGAAARLIPALAADPAIGNPGFTAPVTRNPMSGAEAFSIRAEMKP